MTSGGVNIAAIMNENNIQYFIIDHLLIDDENVHFIFFVNKTIFVNYSDNENITKKIFLNPMIEGIYNIPQNFDINSVNNYKTEINQQIDILNKICHINVCKIIEYLKLNVEDCLNILKDKFSLVWKYYLCYNITNLPDIILNDSNKIIELYENICSYLGQIFYTQPVNDKTTNYSNSRDIKYTSGKNSFYLSNIRQPLHNDYAYYPIDKTPDWLILYSLEQSEYGGYTSLLTIKTLIDILLKYDKDLYHELINKKITYKYEDINIEVVHEKLLLTKDNIINWNYYQLKDEYNNEDIQKIKAKFFNFLENKITSGKIYDFIKKWNKGDAIILNDHLMLHERSAFFGSRWLKDNPFIDLNFPLQS